jgi:ribosomal protein S18 acetylase RimI-like enzyme
VLNGRVVGMVSLAERRHFTGDTDAYISELVIDGSVEGHGAGQALMAAAETRAAERGLSRVTLERDGRAQSASPALLRERRVPGGRHSAHQDHRIWPTER